MGRTNQTRTMAEYRDRFEMVLAPLEGGPKDTEKHII